MRSVVALVLVLALAACADGGDAVRAQAVARCEEAAVQLETIAWPEGADVTLESAAAPLEATAQVHRDLLAVLEALVDDSAAGQALAQLIDTARPLIGILEDAQAAASRGDSPGFDAAMGALVQQAEAAAQVSVDAGLAPCYAAELPE